MRRLEALNAAAFLVDEDGRALVTGTSAKLAAESAQLRRLRGIAVKQDEAERTNGAKEVALFGSQLRSLAAINHGTRRHCGLNQLKRFAAPSYGEPRRAAKPPFS
jgi:hypothetical protein